MKLTVGQSNLMIRAGSQVAAVLIVLVAVFALPCCPRVDGWFSVAQVAAQPAESTSSHQHHTSDTEAADDGPHKGHMASTGSVDVLPHLGPLTLAARLPLLRVLTSNLPTTSAVFSPRIPVPPPRTIATD